MTAPSCIFHICHAQALAEAREAGAYRAPSLASEGFIHLSQAHQVLPVARAFYAGQPDLLLLLVDPSVLSAPLRYEAPQGAAPGIDADDRFPHLYGPIDLAAIVDVMPLQRFSGRPVHPDTVALLRHYRFERLPVEGTLYRSTWRSAPDLDLPTGGPVGTAMIGLFAESPLSVSCFHRLAFDETWHVYGGDPFMLVLLRPDGGCDEVLMGSDPLAGHQVQHVVPAGTWQGGFLLPGGRHALFGCTLAPGFTGRCFEAALADTLAAQYPSQSALIRELAVNGGEVRLPAGFAA
jgi:uncharacterized protein (DUF952 family)/predicted cupin superfamily sugar epimerase